MRVARIKEPDGGYYHVISRVVDRRMVLDDKEKERFRTLLHQAEHFSGVEVLTYAVLDNHFPLLLHVPAPRPVDDALFAERMHALYERFMVKSIVQELSDLRREGHGQAAERLKAPYVARMYELSEFVKTLKQRFTQSYNRRHRRKGTLWEERFKSILIEGRQGALSTVAAYIDLNPLRAGLAPDPHRYRFSGYGEAVGGSRRARQGLRTVMRSLGLDAGWPRVHTEYRKLIYATVMKTAGSQNGATRLPGFCPQELQKVLDEGGRLSLQQALHCRVRYFSDGLVLGSRAYVEDVFHRFRDRFSAKRTSAARKPRHLDLGGLYTARRLRLEPIIVPAG